ncbi:MAG: type II toxin-antitoxin system VapC family toxin [Oscillospiraceae bacterium]|nr:type II toxin-antitoxin system VapC family toxin [Oscillospiraceae bacterium]
MIYMLDTNICIYAIKNKPEAVLNNLKKNLHKGICISSITLAELEHGIQKSAYPEKNSIALIQFLSILSVIPFDDVAAVEYGKICAYLQKKGTPIGTMDMLIAAHAKTEGLILVTNNTREFERVPELELENWAL